MPGSLLTGVSRTLAGWLEADRESQFVPISGLPGGYTLSSLCTEMKLSGNPGRPIIIKDSGMEISRHFG
jgi:hypothetical protein